MIDQALWRRLDTPGHDAAQLVRGDEGWLLRGSAVFLHETGPAFLTYGVRLDRDWRAMRARVHGFISDRKIDQLVTREEEGWTINGEKIAGLSHLIDLDFGFTPATNLPQLRRLALRPGERADAPAAWLDAGASSLQELPQSYERLDDDRYRYEAPSFGYDAVLEIAANGFVARYPQLWEMVARAS